MNTEREAIAEWLINDYKKEYMGQSVESWLRAAVEAMPLAQSPVVPEVPKAVIRSANLKWFDEDDINGTKNALVLRFKDYENIVPFVYFLADMSLLNKEGA